MDGSVYGVVSFYRLTTIVWPCVPDRGSDTQVYRLPGRHIDTRQDCQKGIGCADIA